MNSKDTSKSGEKKVKSGRLVEWVTCVLKMGNKLPLIVSKYCRGDCTSCKYKRK